MIRHLAILALLLLVSTTAWGAAVTAPGVQNQLIGNVGNAQFGGISAASGTILAQQRGLPANQWTSYYVFGDYYYTNPTFFPQMYQTILAKNMGTWPVPFIESNPASFQYDCDIVDQEIFPNLVPTAQNNPLVTWVPSAFDSSFGGGTGSTFTAHLADTALCMQAGLTWLATPQKNKIYASAMTTTGTWAASSIYGGGIAMTTTTNGSALSTTITTDGNGIDLTWLLQAVSTGTASGGAAVYTLDGTTTGLLTAAGNGTWTYNSACSGLCPTSKTPATVRIPAAAGGHAFSLVATSSSSASNPFTFIVASSAPGNPNSTGAAGVYVSGQMQVGGGQYAAGSAALDALIQSLANQDFANGLNVNLVPVRTHQCCNTTTDIVPAAYSSYPFALSALGEQHLADAFGGVIQAQKNPGNVINPLDYGASCDTQLLTDNFIGGGSQTYTVSYTQGSSVINIAGFHPQNCVATKSGGGCNLGQIITVWDYCDPGPTGYITNVDPATGNITVGGWPTGAACSGNGGYALVTGYPSNPNNLATAQDDVAGLQLGSKMSVFAGGKEFLPANCSIGQGTIGTHKPLSLAQGAWLDGNMGGAPYANMNDSDNTPTKLYVDANGFWDDSQYGFLMDYSVMNDQSFGVNLAIRLSNFMLTFPGVTYGTKGQTMACIGAQGSNGPANAEWITDNLAISLCPVGNGYPSGSNYDVGLQATVSGTDLNVTNYTTTNAWGWIPGNNTPDHDVLTVGQPVSFPGVVGSPVVISAPSGVAANNSLISTSTAWGTGHYKLSIAQTATGTLSVSSAGRGGYLNFGSKFTQYVNNGIDINGGCSDCWVVGDIHSGAEHVGWHLGPNQGSAGNAANRIQLVRFEEEYNPLIVDSGFDDKFLGVECQFNLSSGCVSFINGSHGNVWNGGMMQNDGFGGASGGEINLFDSSGGLDVIGVNAYHYNPFGPLLYTATGWAGDNVALEGGVTTNLTSITNFASGGTPVHYKQAVMGWPFIDTTQTNLVVTPSGAVGLGEVPVVGADLDMSVKTGSIALPGGLSSQRPTTPISGMLRNNSSTGNLDLYTNAWSQIFAAIPYFQSGMVLSNDPTTPNTVIDITAGYRSSDDGKVNIANPFPFTKTTGAFSVGAGNGCLDTGSVAASSWYCMDAVLQTSLTPVAQPADYLCYLCSNTAPVMPTNFTEKGLIGVFETDASAHILPFQETPTAGGFTYTKSLPSLDVSTSALGATASYYALDVPPGLQLQASIRASMGSTTTVPAAVLISSVYSSDLAPTTSTPFAGSPGYTLLATATGGNAYNATVSPLLLSTSGTLRGRATTSGVSLSIETDSFSLCTECNNTTVGNIFIDTKNSTSANALVSTTTNVLPLSTNGGNEELVLFSTAHQTCGAITSIVDGASLTWTKRQRTGANGRCVEEWAAPSPGALTGDTITVTYASTTQYSSVYVFAVAGQNVTTPFDPNGSLPALATQGFGTNTSIHNTVSTNKKRDLVFNIYASLASTCGTSPTASAGFTQLFPNFSLNNVSFSTAWTASSYEVTNSALSSGTPTYTVNTCATSINTLMTDALQASGQP